MIFKVKFRKYCLKRPLKIDKTKNLLINGSLMNVKSIAECFLSAFRDNWPSNPILVFFFEWPLKTGFTVNNYEST